MRILISIALAFALMASSHAQTITNILKGTKTFELPISIDDHSRSCGVVQNDLAREVTQTARLAGLNLLPVNTIAPDHFTSFTPSLGIRLNTKKAFNVCATSLELMASTIQNVIIENTGQKGLALVVLWQQHSLEVGHVIDHKLDVQRAVRDLAKKFVKDWALDNKP